MSNMKKSISAVIIFSLLSLLFAATSFSAPQQIQDEEDSILSATENLFIYLKNQQYVAVWNSISAESKQIIVDDVFKESRKAGIEYKKQDLLNDFNSGGIMARAYWDSFRQEFDSNIALEQCSWQMGKIEKNYAEVILKNKQTSRPATLKIYREDHTWKVGLKESFRARKFIFF